MDFEKYNFSDDFQDAVLACMLRYPEQFDVHSDVINPSLFNGVAAIQTVHALRDYYTKYSQWPNFTVLANFCFQSMNRLNPDKAREMFDYVSKLAKVDTRDRQAIFDLIKKFAQERALYRAVRLTHQSLQEGKEIKGGIIPVFEDALAVGSSGEDMGVILQRDYAKIIEEYGTTDVGIATGFQPLNAIWRNGWAPGWLIVPLAPPKRYKTTFCINLALNMAHEALGASDVLYYACEIGQKLAALRALCCINGYKIDDLYDSREKFKKAAENEIGAYVGNILFKGFSAKTAGIAQIKAHARKAIKMFKLKPKAIFIDYAETVRPEVVSKDTPDWRLQADIYTQARAMGSELGCCVIMPDRCKAEFVERSVPNMRAFQGSFEKAGIVDAAIGLCQTEAEHIQHHMRYFLFLNRHGRECVHFEGTVDPERYRMTIEREITYQPDDEEFNQPHRHGSGRKRRNQSPEMLAEAAEVQNENQPPPAGRRRVTVANPE